MKPGNEADAAFLRHLRYILDADAVGLRFADQIGPEVTFRYHALRLPTDIAVASVMSAPAEVRVRRARKVGSSAVESGCAVTWEWRGGTLRVLTIGVSDPGAEYEVTLGIER